MSRIDKPLTAKSSMSDWLKHPVGGELVRQMLAQGGQSEQALRPMRMLSLQRIASLSQGQLSQQMIDELVAKANGGTVPTEADEAYGADDAGEGPDSATGPGISTQPGFAVSPETGRPLREVLVVVGVGGMGETIARRQGAGRHVILADFSEAALERVSASLTVDGFEVQTAQVDVSSRESVGALAAAAASAGPITQVVHTAGLSPAQAPVAAIIAVDLVGVALVLEEFGAIVAPGGAGIVIASMAGYGAALTPEVEQQLAGARPEELGALEAVTALTDGGSAYTLAKRANHLRVQAASVAWGQRGARINSVSPGVISTPMGQQELDGEYGDVMRAMVAASGSGRLGSTTDIADAAAFLLGPTASFITGIDLLVDGGVIASQRAN